MTTHDHMEQATSEKKSAESNTMANTMACSASCDEFLMTGRTGRRNAMADILDAKNAAVGTGGLSFDMEKLNCSENNKPDDSSQSTASPSTSQGS